MAWGEDTTGTEVAAANSSRIKGKVILITGVTPKSLGAGFASTIAAHDPKLLILANRSVSSAEETAKDLANAFPNVATKVLPLDLNSLASVRKAAAEVNGWDDVPKIDVLVNNAGIMANPYTTTEDGFESQFGVNHVAHFLFTNLLMGKILAGGTGARIVSVSSEGYRHGPVRFGDLGFDGGKTYHSWRAYGQAKSANMLFAVALAKKLGSKGVVASSLHPGAIMTNLLGKVPGDGLATMQAIDRELGDSEYWGEFKFKNLDQGVSTHVLCAFDPSVEKDNGAYFMDTGLKPPIDVRPWARDELTAEKLWTVTEGLLGEKFEY